MNRWNLQAAITAGSGVAFGALGAHALEGMDGAKLDSYETAVLYQLVHGLAALALAGRGTRLAHRAIDIFTVGVVLFSGSIYGLVLLEDGSFLGPVTPIGGVLFLVGWTVVAIDRVDTREDSSSVDA